MIALELGLVSVLVGFVRVLMLGLVFELVVGGVFGSI
jgi:hypothetical protein